MWVIKDLYNCKKSTNYLTDESTLENLWVGVWPKSLPLDENYHPKVFNDINEAKRYLREIKRQSAHDWAENSHIHKMYGYSKHEWDLYDYQPTTLEVLLDETKPNF